MPTVFAHEPTGQPSLVERMNRVKHEIGIDSQLPLKKSIKAANEALGLPCEGSLMEQVEVLCTAMWGEAAPEASGLAMPLSQMPKDARPAPQMMQGVAAPGPPIASWDSYATSGAAFCSFKTGQSPAQQVETFRFEKVGGGYATVGSKSGRNEYHCRDGVLLHKQHHGVSAELNANGDFVWSHGYSSRQLGAPPPAGRPAWDRNDGLISTADIEGCWFGACVPIGLACFRKRQDLTV